MTDRRLPLAILLLASTRRGTGDAGASDGGFVTRMARRATGAVADAVEPDAFLDKVDVNALLERVDPDTLLDRVDVNALLDRVDVDRLLDRVDVDSLLDRVDVDRLMDRVDVDALVARVDVEGVVERAGIADIVADSTGALAGSAVDVFRRQVAALDTITERALYRLTGRDPSKRPSAPPGLDVATRVDERGRGQIDGHYAGGLSRLLAFIADVGIMWLGMLLISLGVGFVYQLVGDPDAITTWQAVVWGLIVVAWQFSYFWLSFSIAGKSIGMGVVGIRVLREDGDVLSGSRAAVRTLVLPMSILFFGLGLLGILFGPRRRAAHDWAAGSVVVYDWGDRPAEMPAPITRWIAGREDVSIEELQGTSG